MRFILVACARHPIAEVAELADLLGVRQWRATAIDDDDSIVDLFFYRATIDDAKTYVRGRYPGATFSDEGV